MHPNGCFFNYRRKKKKKKYLVKTTSAFIIILTLIITAIPFASAATVLDERDSVRIRGNGLGRKQEGFRHAELLQARLHL